MVSFCRCHSSLGYSRIVSNKNVIAEIHPRRASETKLSPEAKKTSFF